MDLHAMVEKANWRSPGRVKYRLTADKYPKAAIS